jgi:hypothetical protein
MPELELCKVGSNLQHKLWPQIFRLFKLCQFWTCWRHPGSVAGPVIQATGSSEFEDGLGSGDFVSGYSYHMSVLTKFTDHTKQTKFQSQRPSDVETPVTSTWVQKCSNIGTVSTWMGDRLMGLCSSYLQGNCCRAVGFRCCITSWGNDPDLRAILLLWQRCLKASQVLGQVKTNIPTNL